jgi:hypothetical protein
MTSHPRPSICVRELTALSVALVLGACSGNGTTGTGHSSGGSAGGAAMTGGGGATSAATGGSLATGTTEALWRPEEAFNPLVVRPPQATPAEQRGAARAAALQKPADPWLLVEPQPRAECPGARLQRAARLEARAQWVLALPLGGTAAGGSGREIGGRHCGRCGNGWRDHDHRGTDRRCDSFRWEQRWLKAHGRGRQHRWRGW